MNGNDLLAEFRATRAEAAFSELVRRYTNLVYSIARRRVADLTLAQEITQIVFIRLSNAPPNLAAEAQLLAWLHRTTVHVSIDLWRSESRRRARELHAAAMQDNPTEAVVWNEMTPILDKALDELAEDDRHIILLRFFEQNTMADLARAFGVSEDAAKMRVSRALGRLRAQLGGLGATCSAALLGTLLFERSVEAAPAGLASTLAAIRIAAPAGLAGGLMSLWTTPGAKLVSALAAAALIGTALLLVHTPKRNTNPNGPLTAIGSQGQPGETNTSLSAANSDTTSADEPGEPDPIKLMQNVRRARLRIASGVIDFDVFTFGTVTRRDDTNHLHLKIQFEDGRCWVESLAQEFSYVTPIPGGPEAEEITKRADQMPREQAVSEGLLKPFPSHHVAFFDGQAVTDYWETDSPYPRTAIEAPEQASLFLFDPRCVGITTSIYLKNTVEGCLAYKDVKSVTLLGKEPVEGNLAWHVAVRYGSAGKNDFWIDTLHPARVLKMGFNGNVSLSRYSDTDLKDPLPIEVRNIDFREGIARYETRLVRRNTRYDVPIDPVCWTLDGLHMKVGTDVSDSRIYRRLGYWTGTGLSDELPSRDKPQPAAANRAQLLALLDYEPPSPAALGAAMWIITNSPDGADLQKAADAILQAHIQSPEMLSLIQVLERMRPGCSSNLLQAMANQNPDVAVRGNAWFALATIRKDAAEIGKNKRAAAEAEKLYHRVISEFGQVRGEGGYALDELAQPELAELRRLFIGSVAPEIKGSDLNDLPLKLSDYRGQVVTLLFWSALCYGEYEAREFNRLVDQLDGKAFALVGIHADDSTEKAKAAAEEYHMKWRSFQDARQGPIAKMYNINAWPTIYVLDRQGVIRYRGLHHRSEIVAAVEKLLQE